MVTPALATKPIQTKGRMYDALARGDFGNTIRQWFDVDRWEASSDAARYPLWGVRTLTPGGPCRLNCPREEVRPTAEGFRAAGHGVNISLMIDAVTRVTLWADVFEAETGLMVYGIEHPPRGGSWRALMPGRGVQHKGLGARMLLSRHLNPSSLADLFALLDRYPGHVVELSACETCLGTVPGRNAVVWEVRLY